MSLLDAELFLSGLLAGVCLSGIFIVASLCWTAGCAKTAKAEKETFDDRH